MKRQVIPARVMGVALMLMLLGGVWAVRARAQEPGGQAAGRGRFAGMQRVGGTVTAVSGANLTIKAEDGTTYQVVTTDNTRLMRGRGVSIKLSDVKPGDGVMAMGNLDAPNKTLHAAMVMAIDAEQMKKMEEQHKQELANLGKTLIAGRVTAIDLDNATMTIERPDGVSQTIGFDEGTSFRRGRLNMNRGAGSGASAVPSAANVESGESITLADIKVGDRVEGPGAIKNGNFVPKELTVMSAGTGRRRDGQQPGVNGGAGTAQPGAQPPK
ncbi:MAG TPA: DUF5666 domain-containing protein [Acidobacteriaceae bacterium]